MAVNNITLTKQNNTITFPTKDTYVTDDIVINSTIVNASLNNAATSGVNYTNNNENTTVIPSEGALYINAGWIDNTKITLDHMIPDDADLQNAGTNNIMKDFEAYDVNGKKLIGTLETITPTFTGGTVTATAGGSLTTKPTVTITPIISTQAPDYGFTTTAPSGTEGTNYISIDATGTPTDGSFKATADATRTNVTYNQNTTGHIDKIAGTIASAQSSATQDSKNISVDVTVTDNFAKRYIPITTPTVSGGDLSAGTTTVSAPKFNVNLSVSGTDYGVTETKPSGTDGTNYITITPRGEGIPSDVEVRMSVTRGDIKLTQNAGLTSAKSNATVMASQSQSLLKSGIEVTPTISQVAATKYIPVVTPTFAGGSISGSASVDVTNPTVTVSTAMSTGAADYGVTTTQPTSGEYISITASKSSTNGKATPKGSASRGAVTFSNSAGVIKANSGASALAASSATTLSGTVQDIIPSVTTTNFKSHYIPKATIKAVPGAPTITKPTASASVTVANNSGGTVHGILRSQPTTGDYIKITPGVSTTAGSATSTASAAANSAGVISSSTTGGTVSGTAATVAVTNTTPDTAIRYIKIYDGSYTIG